jgi:acetyltransferase-like isoleucine patch superfamily enzyme
MKRKILKFFYQFIPILSIRVLILRWSGYNVGKGAYIPSCTIISDMKNHKNNLIIGDRVSIGPKVVIVTDSSPNNSRLLKLFPLVSEKVVLEDDVWLGANVTVLPGVVVGKCSVVGSGSVVNKDIPPYSVAVGTPAKVIRQINPDEL